jgi:hypothetical protein
MEACNLTLRGPEADAFADSFLETKAMEAKRSLNKCGVRNLYAYEGPRVHADRLRTRVHLR